MYYIKANMHLHIIIIVLSNISWVYVKCNLKCKCTLKTFLSSKLNDISVMKHINPGVTIDKIHIFIKITTTPEIS